MRRHVSVLFALALVAGLATAAGAAVTFDVDFWATGNPVNNYTKSDGPGEGDLGGTYLLFPGEKINVDLYFSTDQSYIAGSFDLQFDNDVADVLDILPGPPPWTAPIKEFTPGSAKYQALVFPGSTVGPGEDFLFATVILECLGPVDTDLILANYLGMLTLTGGDNIDPPITIGTLNQVPIPGAVWLLGTGLMGLIGIRRKLRK